MFLFSPLYCKTYLIMGGLMDDSIRFKEMVQIDRQFWEITKGLPVPLVPGSLFRLHHSNMKTWGLDISTSGLRDMAKGRSRKFMAKDDHEIENLGPDVIDTNLATEARIRAEDSMARFVAQIAIDVMEYFGSDKELSVMDFGARFGKATRHLVSKMYALINPNASFPDPKDIVFQLVETSRRMAESARSNLSSNYGVDPIIHHSQDKGIDREDIVTGLDSDSFHIIISLSAMHHHSFPDYMRDLFRVLKPGGLLISGDWFSTAWNTPEWAHYLLKTLGSNEGRLERFRDFFQLDNKGCMDRHLLTLRRVGLDDEQRTLVHHLKYWADVQEKMSNALSPPPRRYFLSAHTNIEKRLEELRGAGFIVDMAEIRKSFPKSHMPDRPRRTIRGSNFATVMTAMKPRR
jgi:SAM-dependent methyltransferase